MYTRKNRTANKALSLYLTLRSAMSVKMGSIDPLLTVCKSLLDFIVVFSTALSCRRATTCYTYLVDVLLIPKYRAHSPPQYGSILREFHVCSSGALITYTFRHDCMKRTWIRNIPGHGHLIAKRPIKTRSSSLRSDWTLP